MHECTQKESIGSLKASTDTLNKSVTRLGERINGTFDRINMHIDESPEHRIKIELNTQSVEVLKNDISEIKKSYWKASVITALIVAVIVQYIPVEIIFKSLVRLLFK